MVVLGKVTAGVAFSSALLGTALAHPGEKHDLGQMKRDAALRNIVAASNRRALNGCLGSDADLALKRRAVERREAKLKSLRQKRGISSENLLTRRDEEQLESYMESSHESTAGYDTTTDPSTIFSQNATCAIVPEVTIGPYWVAGELIRSNLTESQPGVPVHLDIQIVDVSTCTGVSDLLIDIWHCNATGVYSGVSATGQGGLDSTFGRGVQTTSSDGVVEFDTIYPGHYTGRTNHIHVKTTADATVLDNGTYADDGTTRHIGQFFFDQDLTSEVEATEPYSSNTQELTTVGEDSIAAEEASEEYDPFLSWVRLGDDIGDGLLMFITVGIDTSADYEDQVSAAAYYYEDGGVDNSEDGGMGGGGGGGGMGGGPDGGDGGMNGTFPSGGAGGPMDGTEVPTDAPTATGSGSDEVGTVGVTATTSSLSTTVPVSGGNRARGIPGFWWRH